MTDHRSASKTDRRIAVRPAFNLAISVLILVLGIGASLSEILNGNRVDRTLWIVITLVPVVLGLVGIVNYWLVADIGPQGLTIRRFRGLLPRVFQESNIRDWQIKQVGRLPTLRIRLATGFAVDFMIGGSPGVEKLIEYLRNSKIPEHQARTSG